MPKTTRNPSVPGATELPDAAASVVTGSPTSHSQCLPHASEEIGFRLLSIHHRPGQMEILRRPRRLLHLAGTGEPEALRWVDLGGVGQQGLVADLEEVAAGHPGGDLKPGLIRVVYPLVQPLRIRGLKTAPRRLLLQSPAPRPGTDPKALQLPRHSAAAP